MYNEMGIRTLNVQLDSLPEDQRNEIEQDFSEIDSLACEGGIQAILDDAEFFHRYVCRSETNASPKV